MRAYITRRVLLILPTVFLASLIVFFVIRLIPGSVIDLMLAQHDVSASVEQTRATIEKALGLDVPATSFCTVTSGILYGQALP